MCVDRGLASGTQRFVTTLRELLGMVVNEACTWRILQAFGTAVTQKSKKQKQMLNEYHAWRTSNFK